MTELKKTRENGDTVCVTTQAVCLTEMLEAFEDFLRGSGFVFSGHLEIVGGEEPDGSL